jgi:hypothetical protein
MENGKIIQPKNGQGPGKIIQLPGQKSGPSDMEKMAKDIMARFPNQGFILLVNPLQPESRPSNYISNITPPEGIISVLSGVINAVANQLIARLKPQA